jgi:hypothetical protein
MASKKPLSGNSALKKTITDLEGLVIQRQRQVEVLAAEQHRLSTRASMVNLVGRHAMALLQLGSMLKGSSAPDGSEGGLECLATADPGTVDCARITTSGGGGGGGSVAEKWVRDYVRQMRRDYDAAPAGDAANCTAPDLLQQSSGSGSGSGVGETDAAVPLGWCPAAAARRAGDAGFEPTTATLRRHLRGFVLTCAPLLM